VRFEREAGRLRRPCWRERPAARVEAADPGGDVLLFSPEEDFGLGDALAAFHGWHRSTLVRLGLSSARFRPGRVQIDRRDPAHYARLLDGARGPLTVYFLGGLEERYYSPSDLEHLERVQDIGAFSLLRLARALARGPVGPVHVNVITNNTQDVLGEEAYHPFAGTLPGLAAALARDLPSLRLSLVDLARADLIQAGGGGPDRRLLAALHAEKTDGELVAWRSGTRLIRSLEEVTLPEVTAEEPPFKQGGVYLLTGDARALKAALGRRLSSAYRARLVFLDRQALTHDEEVAHRDMEALGAEVAYLRADLTERASVQAALREALARFGAVDGVIHAPATPPGKALAHLDERAFAAAIAPGVQGTVVLLDALETEPLDLIAFITAATSFAPSKGEGASAATAGFLGCFGRYLQHRMKRPMKILHGELDTDDPLVALFRVLTSRELQIVADGGEPPARAGNELRPPAEPRRPAAVERAVPPAAVERAVPPAIEHAAAPPSVTSGSSARASRPARSSAGAREGIAIVGMSCVYPGSPDLDAFWEHLAQGRELVTELPPDRAALDESAAAMRGTPRRGRGGFLADVDRFDASFFGISPREARLMDPQQRLFLQVVWAAIEDAGYRPGALAGTNTALFVGVSSTDYLQAILRSGVEIDGQAATGNAHSLLANRASFFFDLHGPSEPINTGAASSLLAVHRAIRSIRDHECEMAIAAGVHVALSPGPGATGAEGAFDRTADGYIRGEGVGAILLKPLRKARADRDHIHGLLLGSAVGHGGQAGATPERRAAALSELLAQAYRDAGVDPSSVSYIEAHGVGVAAGDQAELQALTRTFAAPRAPGSAARRGPACALGNVKANIGHLEAAAGIAGLIKVLLGIRHRALPPLGPADRPRSAPDLRGTSHFIPDCLTAWEPPIDERGRPVPRRAGVSAFGFSGVNAHLVLEEPDVRGPSADDAPGDALEIVPLSARDRDRLLAYVRSLVAFLERRISTPRGEGGAGTRFPRFSDLAYTLQVGRLAMDARLAVIAHDHEQLLERLRAFAAGETEPEGVFEGDARAHRAVAALFGADEQDRFAQMLREGRVQRLAALWATGWHVDWEKVRPHGGRLRVPLPTYPFAKERYWLSDLRRSTGLVDAARRVS
jgi:3-oxoacyl-(acyl-carrier-protein) synthase